MTKDMLQSLENIPDEEFNSKVESGYFSDEALPQVLKEAKARGISVQSVPTEFEAPPATPFYKRHPIITLILIGLLVKAHQTMFGLFKPRQRKLSEMTVKEVMGAIHSKYPGIVTTGEYSPPKYRCSRWILLRGPFYRDIDYNCSILVDATRMYNWAVVHAKNVGHSDEQIEAAKDFFPDWVKDADPDDETVTLLDGSMHRAFRNWDLDFVIFGWTKMWCPECNGFTESFQRARQEFERIKDNLKCTSYLPEWKCEHGHTLVRESDQPIRFF